MLFVQFAPYQLYQNGPEGRPYWGLREPVRSSIDFTPPSRDGIVGFSPEVNIGLMASTEPLPDAYWTFGTGNAQDITLGKSDFDAWEATTGRRPTQGLTKLSDVIADHLILGADPKGNDFAKPLTAGADRRLEIHLDGEIWSHTLTSTSDLFALNVMRCEAEGLAEIFREQGETQYRLACGGVRIKYQLPLQVREYIPLLGYTTPRDDLPLIDDLTPNTTITETFPSTGAITSGQNNTWSVLSGGITVVAAGDVGATNASTEGFGLLGYTFGGSDMIAQFTLGTGDGDCYCGTLVRSNSSLNSGYLIPYRRALSMGLFRLVSGTFTQLGADFANGEMTLSDVLYGSAIGTTLTSKRNGTTKNTMTDSAVSSGTRVGLYLFKNNATTQVIRQPFTFNDTLSSGGSVLQSQLEHANRGTHRGLYRGL